MTVGFANFDADEFLREYWNRKPLLIRNPWRSWHNPLAPDELAGLSCEADVESRLIVQAADQWTVEHGPLAEDRFGQLGSAAWTLLVQAVDHHVPGVADLLEPFRFIPNWRIDDVMVSYAVDGGGVGAHFDQYDVFLIQGLGKRRWQLGGACDEKSTLVPNDDLRLLAEFETVDEWILEPGDILYVPPRIAHRGTAIGHDCMTYSVGFRAPSRSELVEGWSNYLLDGMSEDDRYSDVEVSTRSNPGEISQAALSRLQAMIAESLADRTIFARWFGEFATSPKNADVDWRPDEPISDEEVQFALENGAQLIRNPASRFAFVRQDSNALSLFVDGGCFDCNHATTAGFAEELCERPQIETGIVFARSQPTRELIQRLLDQGCIAFVSGRED